MSILVTSPKVESQKQDLYVELTKQILERHRLTGFKPNLRYGKICIFGMECHNRFCMTDLLKIHLRNYEKINGNLPTDLIICPECYKKLINQYEGIALRLENKRKDFFDQWLAVKIADTFNKMKIEIEDQGCNCGRKDCDINDRNAAERMAINRRFVSLFSAFAFRLLPVKNWYMR